ncbi:MAG TPA: flippase [Thermoguttaceae bacterium]|nr:flippase [Thermoguttaceae bacterium]
MTSATATTLESPSAVRHTAVRRQIRGSSLLLAGRFLAKGVNFAAQVLIVRHLSQSDYGALAYALSIVVLGQDVAAFGLHRAVSRFLPIYQEKRQYDKLFGTMIMVTGIVLSIGLLMAVVLYACQGPIARAWIGDPRVLSLLLVLIFLAPVEAFDKLLLGMFAVFASPRSIFFRKHVLGPGLKLLVVVLLILGEGSVYFLAVGYLAAAALGVAIYTVVLFRLLKRQGLFRHFHLPSITMPWREVLTFTIPLLTSELVYVVMHTMDVIVLQYYAGVGEVAVLRAVQPLALMNQVVMASFAMLFTPLAARMFARNDRRGINQLYWQTAIWIAVFSFPIFAVTFSIAGPVTVMFYGARYEQSAAILSLLSLGCFFNAALGFNGLTLKVYGKLKYVVAINVAAAVLNLIAILLLVPRYGALGAAIGTCGALIAHNVLKHAGLRLGTGIRLFQRRTMKVYASIAVAAVALWALQAVAAPPVFVSLALAAVVSLLVLRMNRRLLRADEIFPELLRLPLAKQLLGR